MNKVESKNSIIKKISKYFIGSFISSFLIVFALGEGMLERFDFKLMLVFFMPIYLNLIIFLTIKIFVLAIKYLRFLFYFLSPIIFVICVLVYTIVEDIHGESQLGIFFLLIFATPLYFIYSIFLAEKAYRDNKKSSQLQD